MDSKITLIEKTPYNFLKDIFDANYTRDKNNEKNVGLFCFLPVRSLLLTIDDVGDVGYITNELFFHMK